MWRCLCFRWYLLSTCGQLESPVEHEKHSSTLIKIQIVLPVKIRCAHKVLAQGAIQFKFNVYIYHHNSRKELWKLEGHTWTSSTTTAAATAIVTTTKIKRWKNSERESERERKRFSVHIAHRRQWTNEHIHGKNLFISSIYVCFLLFFTIAFYLYAQIYYIILLLCFSPFETGVSLSGVAEKKKKCSSYFGFFHFIFLYQKRSLFMGEIVTCASFALENQRSTNREWDENTIHE